MARGPTDLNDQNIQYANSLRFLENSFLQFLQAIFSLRKEGQLKYSDDDSTTEIKIEGQRTDNLKTVDTRPKITVARGPVAIAMSGIGNFVGSQNLSQLQVKYASIRDGSVGISCFSREELEADTIAEFIADTIVSLRPVLQKFGYLQIEAVQIGQRALVKTDARDELFVTPVLVKVKVTKNYKSEITDAVKLRKIIYEYYIRPVGLEIKIGEKDFK